MLNGQNTANFSRTTNSVIVALILFTKIRFDRRIIDKTSSLSFRFENRVNRGNNNNVALYYNANLSNGTNKIRFRCMRERSKRLNLHKSLAKYTRTQLTGFLFL